MKKSLYFSVLFVSIGYSITLNDIVGEAVEHNPSIIELQHSYEASIQDLEVVKAKNRPTLDLRGEKGKERTESPANQNELRIYNESQVSLIGKYNVYDGENTKYKILEKKSAKSLAEYQLKDKASGIAFKTIQVYLDVLRKKRLFEISVRNYDTHQETLNGVEKRVNAGDGYESDVQQTKARVDLAESNRVVSEKNYLNTQINYRRLLMRLPNVNDMALPYIKENISDLDIEKSIERAEDKNFKIKIDASKSKISDFVYKQEDSKYYPTLDIEASQNWNKDVYGIQGKDDSSKIALVLNYNLYNGGADKASKLASLKRRDMNLESMRDSKLFTEELLRISQVQYRMLSQQEKLLERQLKHLLRTTELYDKEYKNSKRTIIDVLNVKQEFNSAESQKINIEFDKLLAYYQFKLEMGELLEEFKLEEKIMNYSEETENKISSGVYENSTVLTDVLAKQSMKN